MNKSCWFFYVDKSNNWFFCVLFGKKTKPGDNKQGIVVTKEASTYKING